MTSLTMPHSFLPPANDQPKGGGSVVISMEIPTGDPVRNLGALARAVKLVDGLFGETAEQGPVCPPDLHGEDTAW